MKQKMSLQGQSKLLLAEDQKSSRELIADLIQFRRMHAGLLILTVLLVALGLVMMFSVSLSSSLVLSSGSGNGTALFFFKKQLMISILGVGAMIFIGRFIHVRKFNKWAWAAMVYGTVTLMLIYNKFKATTIFGAQRWIRLGPLTIQVSEVAKIAAVFVLAFYFSHLRAMRSRDQLKLSPKFARYALFVHAFIDFTLPVIAMGLWLLLILIQPHLSGAIIFSLIVLSCFLVAKIPARSWLVGSMQCLALLLVCVLLLSIFMPVFTKQSLSDFVGQRFAHVLRRVATHESPEDATADELYHVRQARLAMGAGGLDGVGFGQGRQKFNYLPMGYNDYIFPALGEELGFVGTTTVLLAFLIFMYFGLSITVRANSLFALIIAWGYTMLITIQALLHMVVTLGLVPATGISLPFFSYGGSSNLFFLVAVGLILSVSRTAQRSPKELRLAFAREKSSVRPVSRRFSGLRAISRRFSGPKRKKVRKQVARPRQAKVEYPQISRSNRPSLNAKGFARTRSYLDRKRHSS
ncbi:MAG: FtsW/RodA/SpoVE family cell cycle protein [Eubacteriales bacterium]|nr:FtsW/RodA/SpoVE family cell cycle protein [Eubacteriales bacterium]